MKTKQDSLISKEIAEEMVAKLFKLLNGVCSLVIIYKTTEILLHPDAGLMEIFSEEPATL